jgi:regulator of protease activity HflC (stomatin/prohibitin superfamily)
VFDKLLEMIERLGLACLPFTVLQPFEAGVLVRLGTFKRVLGSGFHWVWPFGIDKVWDDHITPMTHNLAGMSTMTQDGKEIGFDAIITYRIVDIEKAILRVTLVKDAIVDTCQGIIGTTLNEAKWDDILHGTAVEALTEACRKRGWKWGIEIIQVQLAGVCRVKNIRLSGHQSQTQEHRYD